MTPTNELRWVQREVVIQTSTDPFLEQGKAHYLSTSIVTTLQQKWVTYWSDDMGGSPREWEWRDIETVKEQP